MGSVLVVACPVGRTQLGELLDDKLELAVG